MSEWRLATLHLHGRGLILPSLMLIGATGFIGYAMRGLRDGGSWLMWAGIAAVVAVLLGLLPIIGWLRHRVVITTVKTVQRHGFLGVKKREMPHHHVARVTLKQNSWQRLFGSGDVVLDAVNGARLQLHDVPNVVTVAQALRELTGNVGAGQTGVQEPLPASPLPPQL